jgi:hypothetical protein
MLSTSSPVQNEGALPLAGRVSDRDLPENELRLDMDCGVRHTVKESEQVIPANAGIQYLTDPAKT